MFFFGSILKNNKVVKGYMRIMLHLKEIIKKIASLILPIDKKKIVFINFNGRGYGCNPKYIAEEIILRNKDYKLVWLVKNMNEDMPNRITKVPIKSVRAKIELLTAKMWVFNVRNYKGVEKRKGQYYIQTWHSSIGFKKIEGDIKEFPEKRKQESMYDGSITDLMFANNAFRYEQIKRAFWYNGSILKCGIPRNTVLFDSSKFVRQKVRNWFHIPEDVAIVLYAPTFREHSSTEVYIWDYKKVCKAFNIKFGKSVIMLLRLHPNIVEQSEVITFNKTVINASNYSDIQELLSVADYLITDFSSCAFDFSFVRKPVWLFVKDKNQYLESERELLLNTDEIPYTIAETEEILIKNIMNYSEEIYEKRCDEFFERIGLHEDGHGAEVVVDWIEEKMKR